MNDVSIDIKKGETVGIIGKNGSGKSTLLQILAGVLSPSAGTVDVHGRITALLELGTGFNPELTGIENVYFSAMLMGISKEEMDGRIDKILAFADIGDFVHQPVRTYSSGMYVRLAFSIYANIEPDIFIVDEALAVGDAFFIHRCMLRFKELQDQGKTILFVSHGADSIKRLCQRAIWLDQGKVQMIGPASEVIDHYLAFLFKRPVVESKGNAVGLDEEQVSENSIDVNGNDFVLPAETRIPNMDRRLGTQECTITGVSLYDPAMKSTVVCPNDSEIILRMTIINQSFTGKGQMVVGHIFRDHKGIEIASTNSEMEEVPIPQPGIGKSISIRQKILLPILYPGKYSLTPTTGWLDDHGEFTLFDRIDNAILFEITSKYRLHVLMKFKTDIVVEKGIE